MRHTSLEGHRVGSSPRRRGRPRRRGAALIEMVVVFIVLFYLAMGMVEFGWYLFAKHAVQAAARDAARQGIISGATQAQVNTAITETMTAAGFQSSGYTTTYTRINLGTTGALTYTTVSDIATIPPGEGLRVTISAPFSGFRVRPLGVIPATKPVMGVTTMVKE